MPVVSTAASTRAMVGEDGPEWPIGGAWYHHDWSERGNQAPQNYKAAIETRLGTARDLDDSTRIPTAAGGTPVTLIAAS